MTSSFDSTPQPAHCARLCRLARMYIAGVSTRLIDSTFDLKGCRFGILSGSSFGTRLRYESRDWGFELPRSSYRRSRNACRRWWFELHVAVNMKTAHPARSAPT